MVYRTLGKTNLSVSQIGFGASPLGDVFGRTDSAEGVRAVHRAVDLGVNFFDVSPFYGSTLAEERLGKALAGIRGQVVLATKCGRYGQNSFDFSSIRIKGSVEESLSRLQTDYLDLLQAHDVEFGDVEQILNETIPTLREIQQSGKVRYVGITGYPLQVLRSIAERERVDTILSYCHYNLLATDLDAILTPFAEANGIGLINASPLHMGLLSGSPIPEWHPAPVEVRRAAAEFVDFCQVRGLNPAVVGLRFCIGHPYVASTLIGMSTCKEVETNIEALAFEIEPALQSEIEDLVASAKNVGWPSGSD